jgi:hypothetical protein
MRQASHTTNHLTDINHITYLPALYSASPATKPDKLISTTTAGRPKFGSQPTTDLQTLQTLKCDLGIADSKRERQPHFITDSQPVLTSVSPRAVAQFITDNRVPAEDSLMSNPYDMLFEHLEEDKSHCYPQEFQIFPPSLPER